MTPIPLARMERNARVLVTLFLLTMLIAFGIAGMNVYDKVGRSHASIRQRYGPDPSPSALSASDSGGDLAAMPAENDPMVVRSNTFSQLVDITHAHAFELPLVLFVLAHFLMRTRIPEWFKLLNYVASMGGVVLFLSAPWLVRYVSLRATILFSIGATLVFATALSMTLLPIWDMWRNEQL